MGIIVKNFEITKGLKSHAYINIDSICGGMMGGGSITIYTSLYINQETRASEGEAFKYNHAFFLKDENIPAGKNSHEVAYIMLTRDFEAKGYKVVRDNETYEVYFNEERLEIEKAKLIEMGAAHEES